MTPRWRFALLGEHVAYTRSPDIFKAIGDFLGAYIGFEVFDCRASDIAGVVKKVAQCDFDGLSVTIPHKEHVCSYLDKISGDAGAIGAVNCVERTKEGTVGHNTDWGGFLAPLKKQEVNLAKAKVVIFGSGGAARAVAYGLRVSAIVREIVVVSRNEDRIPKFREAAGNTPVRFQSIDEIVELRRELRDSRLVVNATPLGGGNAPDGGVLLDAFVERPGTIYYDLNYNRNNALLQRASECGSVTIDGAGMLVAQALKSFELWTGTVVPFEPIFRSVFGASTS